LDEAILAVPDQGAVRVHVGREGAAGHVAVTVVNHGLTVPRLDAIIGVISGRIYRQGEGLRLREAVTARDLPVVIEAVFEIYY
jgi:hypothetical protein